MKNLDMINLGFQKLIYWIERKIEKDPNFAIVHSLLGLLQKTKTVSYSFLWIALS